MNRSHLRGVFLVFLLVIAASAWASAQLYQSEPIDPPVLLSGPDVGFRIESRRGGDVYGRLVVRIDGEWVEVNVSGPGPVRRLGST
jgi:hypothetical protein